MALKVPALLKKNSTPAKQISGTGYKAAPAVPVPTGSYNETGSARGSVIPEVVPELVGRAVSIRTYTKMIRSDASVSVSLRAGKAPVLGGDYYIDQYDDTPESAAIAEFVRANIFHIPSSPWLLVLQEILHFMEYGSSVLEKVWELREWAPKKTNSLANRKQYTMLKKLTALPATSIAQFTYDDNGGPASVIHNALRKDNSVEQVEIPIDKLVVFAFESVAGNLDGVSVLRSAYKHWYYKETFYKIDAIQKERHGIGVPDIELPPNYTKKDKDAAHELGRNLRSNERAYIVRPPGLTVGFAELSGNLVDVMASAAHHDNMIMKNVLVQFLNMGVDGGGGGRATGATAADMFLKSMRYLANMICENINKFLIPQIVAYNFETDQFPCMKVRNVGETKDLQMWASAMANLVDKNLLTMDDESEQFVRDIVDWPKKLQPRPVSTDGPSNVKQQYLLKDNPDTPQNEDLAGQAALQQGTGGGGTGTTTGNVGKSPTSAA